MKKITYTLTQSIKYTYPVGILYLLTLLIISCGRAPISGQEREYEESLKKAEKVSEGQKQEKNRAELIDLRKESEKKMREEEQVSQNLDRTVIESSQRCSTDTRQQVSGEVVNKEEILLSPQELLDTKLSNPHKELNPTQSITLLNHCAELGEQNVAQVAGKEVVMVMGNTGTGKSTTINALMGCQMRVDHDEFEQEVIIVDPQSPLQEIMPIGHGLRSQTFLPQIAPDPMHSHRAYCDCPGFSDNRGPEINIANAINIKRVSQGSAGVKAVLLTNYNGIADVDRGSSISTMEKMCRQLFGNVDNLRIHQNAVLLGIIKAPIYKRNGQPFSLNTARAMLTEKNSPIAQILANRIFLFDPLDRGSDNPDFWSMERCRNEIAQLESIPQHEATKLFQTVLTSDDRIKLLDIARQIREPLTNAIKQEDEKELKHNWQAIQRLRAIGHDEVEQFIQGEVLPTLMTDVLKLIEECKEHAHAHNFKRAEEQLEWLTRVQNMLPETFLELNLPALRQTLEHCRAQYAEQQRLETSIN